MMAKRQFLQAETILPPEERFLARHLADTGVSQQDGGRGLRIRLFGWVSGKPRSKRIACSGDTTTASGQCKITRVRSFLDGRAPGVTVAITAQPLRFAAGCWFPGNVQCLADLQPAAFEPWPVTAHWSNKIAGVFFLLQASNCVPSTSRAGTLPWVQPQQPWPLLLHKPPVGSAREIASSARAGPWRGWRCVSRPSPAPLPWTELFPGGCGYPPSAASGGFNSQTELRA